MSFLGRHPEVMQLHLRPRPRQRQTALEAVGVVVTIRDLERRLAGRGDERREGHSGHRARREAQAAAQTENRIEHRADRARQRRVVHDRGR